MKRILLGLLLLTTLGAAAQNKKKSSPKPKYTPEKVAAMEGRQEAYQGAQNRGNAAYLKKDGTPDMRYSENKGKGEGPKKKDGTPDMRYSQNKKGSSRNN